MAVYYKVVEKKDPRNPQGAGKYYAQAVNFGIVDTDMIAENVARRTGHSPGQVKGLFRDYTARMREYLANGKTVRLDPVGMIHVTLRGSGSDTAEEYDPSNVTRVRLNFRPSASLKYYLRLGGGGVELRKFGFME